MIGTGLADRPAQHGHRRLGEVTDRAHPEAAERLRIPGSIEGIDRRLGAATGER